jgi:transporter family-2 protein
MQKSYPINHSYPVRKSSIINQKNKGHKMESILVIMFIGLAGGVAIGLQSPLASLLSQKLGVFESVFIVHLGGVLIALIPLLIYGGGKLSQWRSVPWYAPGAGIFGLAVIASISFMILRVGIAAAITTLIAGQLLMGTILDHYGLLGATIKPLGVTRIIGMSVVMVGVWLTVR